MAHSGDSDGSGFQFYFQELNLPVNVSSHQLRRPHLERTVGAALALHGLGGECLRLELTESAIMETGTNATETLDAIKALGVPLSLDDFGTGYSSLSYLCRFPIDELKIDRSFVSECDAIQNSADHPGHYYDRARPAPERSGRGRRNRIATRFPSQQCM